MLGIGIPKVQLYIAIVLSYPLIGCWATERANQRAVQNSYNKEPDFGVPGVLYFLNVVKYLYYKLEFKGAFGRAFLIHIGWN